MHPMLWAYRRLAHHHGLGTQHQALVVLGGGFAQAEELRSASMHRARTAAALYQEWPCPVIFSGGATHPKHSGSEAKAMADIARELGVAPQHTILEENSRNTWENALYTVMLLKERSLHNVMVITCPHHSLRAFLCFRAQGCLPIMYQGPLPGYRVGMQSVLKEYGALMRDAGKLF